MENRDDSKSVEIKIELEEPVVKDEPEDMEECGSLEIKHETNPPTHYIRDHIRNAEICSAHFTREFFLIKSETNRLKPDAVPSIFQWNNTKVRKSPNCLQKGVVDKGASQAPEEASHTMNQAINEKEQTVTVKQEPCDAIETMDNFSLFEIKLEEVHAELIIKDEPENVTEECSSFEMIKYKANSQALCIEDRIANSEIKTDPLICTMEDFDDIPAHIISTNTNNCRNSELQIEIEKADEDMAQSQHHKVKENKCNLCGRYFTQSHSLKKHMSIHEPDRKPFKCQQCDKSFSKNDRLSKHLLVHEQGAYKCPQCDKAFNLQSRLKVHMIAHTGIKSFVCELCGKAFAHKDGLKTHTLIHEDKRPFQCPLCDKTFRHKINLQSHVYLHADEKPFKCQLCDKTFTRKDYLKQHILIHEGNNPFKCQLCDKTFIRNDYLKKHMLVHEGKRDFQCPQCGKCFYRNVHLNRHILVVHEDKNRIIG